MINILCWKWRSDPTLRAQFTSEHVNIFASMIARNTTVPYKLTCITDDSEGIDSSVNIMPIWDYPIVSGKNPKKPNCYRRLRIFSNEAKELFGERVISIDLDAVITRNIDHLLIRKEDFIGWHNPGGVRYQGSLTNLKTGTRTFIWNEFDPKKSPILAKDIVGTDQAWVTYRMSPDEAVYTPDRDGVYSYKKHIRNKETLPENACIVFFHGTPKPWFDGMARGYDWILNNWKL